MKTVYLPGDDSKWAILKEKEDFSWEDRHFIQSASMVIATTRDPDEHVRTASKAVVKLVTQWTLTAKGGDQILPVAAESLRVMDPDQGDWLAGECMPIIYSAHGVELTGEQRDFFTKRSTPRSRTRKPQRRSA